jgi:hypothetical protein
LQKWLTQTAKQLSIWNSQLTGVKNLSFGLSIPMMYMGNLGTSSGWSHSYTDAESIGQTDSVSSGVTSTESFSESNGVTSSQGVTHTNSVGQNASINHTDSQSASSSVGHTEGDSYNVSQGDTFTQTKSANVTNSSSVSQGSSLSQTVTDTQSESASTSVNITNNESNNIGRNHNLAESLAKGFNNAHSNSRAGGFNAHIGASGGAGVSLGPEAIIGKVSGDFGINGGVGGSISYTNSDSIGVSDTRSSTESFGDSAGYSTGQSLGTTFGNTISRSSSTSVGKTDSVSVSNGVAASEGFSEGSSKSLSQSWGKNTSDSITNTRGNSTSDGWSKGISQSESVGSTQSQSASKSVSHGYTTGTTQTTGQSNSWSQSKGTSSGTTGGTSSGASATLGVGPSLSYSKSYQWLDMEVQNIITLLEFQNNRLMKALNGSGAFFSDIYIATSDKESSAAAKMLAKSTWYNENALICPLQVMDLSEDEQSHLLYHFNAFSPDTAKEAIPGTMESYRYSTILLPEEYSAYTHPPRISEGGVFADVNDIPKFAVPSMRKGEIYMGQILSGERYTQKWGYVTPFDYRISSDELMHGFFTGESRSGKTVAATRFIAELANKVRRSNGKRLRIVCMDPKQDWRILAKFIEPERFHFYSLGNPEFLPINLNICKIPKNVYPQQWIDGVIEIYCRAYGLGERGKSVLSETFYQLYEEAGVFVPNWREVAPERSKYVTLPKIYERMRQIKIELEDPKLSGKGRVGNDVRDAYARVLDRLQVFGRSFSIEAQLFGCEDGIGIDDLIGQDDVVVLESYGLETTFKNFVFGVITAGFFKYAQAHEGGFKAPDQYETVLVIEEANEVLTGERDNGDNPLKGQSEFEKILDQSAGLGLFIFSITQKIADMPSSIIANSGLVFAGKISRVEDVTTVIRKIGREERYEDRDLTKWFPRSPIGWFVCRSSRNFDFKESEPVLVKVAPLNVDPPSNEDLLHIIAKKEAKKQQMMAGLN